MTECNLISAFSCGIHNSFHFILFHPVFSSNQSQVLTLPPCHSLLLLLQGLFSSFFPPPPSSISLLVFPFHWADVLFCAPGSQCVPHHSLCFLLSGVLLSVAATHAREKGEGEVWGADVISRWRFHHKSSGAQCGQRRAMPERL